MIFHATIRSGFDIVGTCGCMVLYFGLGQCCSDEDYTGRANEKLGEIHAIKLIFNEWSYWVRQTTSDVILDQMVCIIVSLASQSYMGNAGQC